MTDCPEYRSFICMSNDTVSPENLKQFREKNGIKRELLAEAMGVHDRTLYRWEEGKGKGHPKKHTMKAWHHALSDLIVEAINEQCRIREAQLTAVRGTANIPTVSAELVDLDTPDREPAIEGRQGNDRNPEPVAGDPSHQTCADWSCPICNPPEAR